MSYIGRLVRRRPLCYNWDGYWGAGINPEYGLVVYETNTDVHIAPRDMTGIFSNKTWGIPKEMINSGCAFVEWWDRGVWYKNKKRGVV